MKKIFIISLVIASAAVAAYLLFFREPVFNATGGFLTNIDSKGVILEGYDPVAYFTDSKPVIGNRDITSKYDGAIYWFSSTAHKYKFDMEPQKYAPQYGAFCGYAVSIGKLRPVDPKIFQIENGRLILQHTQEAYDLFNEDLKGNIVKADANWPGIVATHVGKPLKYDKQAPAATAKNTSAK